ncbi:MAG: hypothetical protein Q8J97_00395, partial [Flavobacteriaceae bacterium]|nr:hypothetical protein [Flavobacteriaceae bacterium]
MISNSDFIIGSSSGYLLRTFSFLRADTSSYFPPEEEEAKYTYRNGSFRISNVVIQRSARLQRELYVASFENRITNATHSDVLFELRNVTLAPARGVPLLFFSAFFSRSYDESVRISDLFRFRVIVDGFFAEFEFIPSLDSTGVIPANHVHPLFAFMHNRFHNLTLAIHNVTFRTIARQALLLQTRESITFIGITKIDMRRILFAAETTSTDPLVPAAIYMFDSVVAADSTVALRIEHSHFVVATNTTALGAMLLALVVSLPRTAALNVSVHHSNVTLLSPFGDVVSVIVRCRLFAGRTPTDQRGRHAIDIHDVTALAA